MATQEQCHTAEAAAFASREAELVKKEMEAASHEAALDVRAQALANREEATHREAAAAITAKDRAAVVE